MIAGQLYEQNIYSKPTTDHVEPTLKLMENVRDMTKLLVQQGLAPKDAKRIASLLSDSCRHIAVIVEQLQRGQV